MNGDVYDWAADPEFTVPEQEAADFTVPADPANVHMEIQRLRRMAFDTPVPRQHHRDER